MPSMLIDMPEPGHIEGKKITAFAGFAPMTQQSGKWQCNERITRDRSSIRCAIYMPKWQGKQGLRGRHAKPAMGFVPVFAVGSAKARAKSRKKPRDPPGGVVQVIEFKLNMVTPTGLEPVTCPLGGGCSIQLSHGAASAFLHLIGWDGKVVARG